MEMLFTALMGFVVALITTVLHGLLANWALKSLTRAREPAFAAYCWTFGAMVVGAPRFLEEEQPGWVVLTALAGVAAALVILWRRKVVPERAAAEAEGA